MFRLDLSSLSQMSRRHQNSGEAREARYLILRSLPPKDFDCCFHSVFATQMRCPLRLLRYPGSTRLGTGYKNLSVDAESWDGVIAKNVVGRMN